jgi:hypothetical protein
MSRFWVSWYQPTEDYRPLTYPPNNHILGWWCSGHAEVGSTICAAIEAENEEAAREAVLKDWPEAFDVEDWRFINEKPNDWKPGDRFSLSDWMIERFQK